MIILLYALAIFGSGSAQNPESQECQTCIAVNGTCFNVSHILDLEAPFRNQVVIREMGILRSENMLFYSFEPAIEDSEYSKIGFVYLEGQNATGVIASDKLILNFGTLDIDQDNAMVYLGGSDGIFLLDINQNKLSSYSSRGDTVWKLFFKSNVNFVKNNEKGIIVKRGDDFKILLENIQVRNFVINKYDVVVFSNNSGLFAGKGNTVARLSQNPFFRGLNIDLDGVIYAWWIDGIYRIMVQRNVNDARIFKVATVPGIGALAFDNDNNIVFTSEKGLYRITPTEGVC